ncbi:MAG: alpha-hydroxy acid oxidase [Legionellales bacterium]
MNPVSVFEYRALAKSKLPNAIFDYIDGGACDEITKRNNRDAFDAIHLRPLCLRDVSSVDPSITLIHHAFSSPILVAPTAFHQLVDKQGEISTAKAAKSCGIPMVVSTMSNLSLEDIAADSLNDNLWLQLYVFKNRSLTEELIHRAEKANYKAIMITVGNAIPGKRERDLRNQFTLPPELSIGNFKNMNSNQAMNNFIADVFDPSLTWHDIEWVLSITKLPVILKGIMNPSDADKACQLDVSGIVVSNHGGRQLDTSEATILALPDIVNTVAGRTSVLLDGGIQRGTDIFKAIALGADAVLLGRPILWALAVNGMVEVENLLMMLKNEFEMVMKLSGCLTVQDIKSFTNCLSHPVLKPLKNL